MRVVSVLLLLAIAAPASAGERSKCNDLQLQLGLCDADGYLSGPLVSESDMEILRNATAEDFSFMEDPAVRKSTERLGKSLEALDSSTGDYLRTQKQVQEELDALETLMRDNPALFEALIAEEQQKVQVQHQLQPQPRLKVLTEPAPSRPALKPLTLKPLPTTGIQPTPLVTLDLSAKPTLKPLVLPPLDTSSPTPRLDALRLARKPGTVRPLPVQVGVISDAARVPPTQSKPAYVVGEPVPYTARPAEPRTWAGWAWDTAGSAWTWVVGE